MLVACRSAGQHFVSPRGLIESSTLPDRQMRSFPFVHLGLYRQRVLYEIR